MKKDLFLFIDYANDTCKKIQAYTLRDLIAQAFDLDEDSTEVHKEARNLTQYEYDTWVNKSSGYCIVMLPKK